MTLLEFYQAMEQGKLVEPVTRVVDRDEGETFLTGEKELDELDEKGSPKREQYRVLLVPGENEATMSDLLNNSIKVEVKERKSPFSPFLTMWSRQIFSAMVPLMVLLFLGLAFFGSGRRPGRLPSTRGGTSGAGGHSGAVR